MRIVLAYIVLLSLSVANAQNLGDLKDPLFHQQRFEANGIDSVFILPHRFLREDTVRLPPTVRTPRNPEPCLKGVCLKGVRPLSSQPARCVRVHPPM